MGDFIKMLEFKELGVWWYMPFFFLGLSAILVIVAVKASRRFGAVEFFEKVKVLGEIGWLALCFSFIALGVARGIDHTICRGKASLPYFIVPPNRVSATSPPASCYAVSHSFRCVRLEDGPPSDSEFRLWYVSDTRPIAFRVLSPPGLVENLEPFIASDGLIHLSRNDATVEKNGRYRVRIWPRERHRANGFSLSEGTVFEIWVYFSEYPTSLSIEAQHSRIRGNPSFPVSLPQLKIDRSFHCPDPSTNGEPNG